MNSFIFPGEAPYISPEKQVEIYQAIKEDSVLPNHIQAKGKAKNPSAFCKILLTGVTGHLGPYLLQQLSQQGNLTHIFCLVRAPSIQQAQERVIKKLRVTNLLEKTKLAKIHYICGDVSQHNLGLDENSFSILSNIIDAVVHNAVYSNHVKSYPISENGKVLEKCPMRAVNVAGVKNILEFAANGVTKHVLHGSSFSCVNKWDASTGTLIEELPDEDNLGDGIAWGYAYSKFVGEKLMKTALEQRGIPVSVIRYPIIIGDSTTGFIADLDNLTLVLLSFFSLGLFPNSNCGMIMCPADTCALIATKLFFNDEAPTGVYNLIPPFTSLSELYNVALNNGVTSIRTSTYEEYVDALLNCQNPSNQILTAFKKIYSKDHGLKEFSHLCPAMRLLWYRVNFSKSNKKLEKYVSGCDKLIPNPQKCSKTIIDFFKNSGLLSEFEINVGLTFAKL